QPHRHDRGHGDARLQHRRCDAAPRHRAQRRPDHPRPDAGRLRGRSL
ncbi:MAG: Cell-division-associated, ABC-transporter-like signaling protein FtsE, partial [uncultured Blastococcus sp.]